MDGEPLLQRDVQRDQPPEGGGLAVGRPKVHGGGDDGGAGVELHPRCEGAGSAADVQGEPDRGGLVRRDGEELRDCQIQVGSGRGKESRSLCGHVEAKMRRQAGEALAGGGGRPDHGGVGEGSREGIGGEGDLLGGGGGEAAAARKGVAAAEGEDLGEVVWIGGAGPEWRVGHVAVKELGVVMAGGGDGGERGVEEEIGGG